MVMKDTKIKEKNMTIAYSDVVNSSENVNLQDLVIIINKNIKKNNALIKKVFPSEEGYPLISRINRMEVEGNLLGSDDYGKDKIRITVWGKDVNGEDIVGNTYTIKPEDFPDQ